MDERKVQPPPQQWSSCSGFRAPSTSIPDAGSPALGVVGCGEKGRGPRRTFTWRTPLSGHGPKLRKRTRPTQATRLQSRFLDEAARFCQTSRDSVRSHTRDHLAASVLPESAAVDEANSVRHRGNLPDHRQDHGRLRRAEGLGKRILDPTFPPQLLG